VNKNQESRLAQPGPLFFIVTTVFNGANYLKTTLESMLKQTTNRFVHYIYDDGSQDHPDALIQDYISKANSRDKPFKVIYQKGPNLGVDPAHVQCYKLCTLPFLMWLDAGDFLAPDFFANVESQFRQHPQCTWLRANSYFVDPQGNRARFANDHGLNLRELARKDQYGNFSSGSNFNYGIFVIDWNQYLKINPQLFFINGKNYGGFYYDCQIIFAMSLSGQPFCFLKKPLTYLLDNPMSFSRNQVNRKEDFEKGKDELISHLAFTERDRTIFRTYREFSKQQYSVRSFFFEGQYKEARLSYSRLKKMFGSGKLPSYYFWNRSMCRGYYYASLFPWLSRPLFRKKGKKKA
jgi:glycosyltransferase involved in cell wall biosynthesis